MVRTPPPRDVAEPPPRAHAEGLGASLAGWPLTRAAPEAITFAAALLLTIQAWTERFVMDDAFISFRYARHLVEGEGLVFNVGERVEGYTNFLWTLLLSAGLALGLDPVLWAMLLGLACFAAGLLVLERLARQLALSLPARMAVLLMVGLCHTSAAFATGGLETSLVGLLALLALHRSETIASAIRVATRDLLLFSAILAASLWTRLDMAVLLAAPALRVLLRGLTETRSRLRFLLCAFAPAAMAVGAWLAWKWQYYGQPLPNTWDAKQGGDLVGNVEQGLRYAWTFALAYWLLPLLVPLLGAQMLLTQPRTRWIALSVACWLLYVVAVGGGFMEFRLLSVVIAPGALLGVWVTAHPRWSARVGAIATTLLATFSLVASVHHARTFGERGDIESTSELAAHVAPSGDSWLAIGTALGELFGGAAAPPTIALMPAGAIPFASRLPTLDMLGLTDRQVARHGLSVHLQPGHRRLARFEQLMQRPAHLVLGHPAVAHGAPLVDPLRSVSLQHLGILDATRAELPAAARLLELPLPGGWLYALYLNPHPAVDEAVAARGLRAWSWRQR